MFDDIRNKQVEYYDFHSEAARDLLSKLLVKDPSERLTDADQIMKHEFYKEVDWDRLMLKQISAPYKPIVKGPTDTSHFDA